MLDSIRFSKQLRKQIEDYLEEYLPEEACGLLGGRDGSVEVVLPVTNELHSPMRFRMDAPEQLRAILQLEEQEMDLMGIFHSHPRGPEFPSDTDIQEHAYPESAVVICSLSDTGWVIRAFSIQGYSVFEIELVFY